MEGPDEELAVLAKPRAPSHVKEGTSPRIAATMATRKALVFCYGALVAVLVPFMLLTALAPSLWRGEQGPAESTFTCTGDAAESRRCVFNNAVVENGVIWLYSPRALNVPPMLCSAVNQADPYRAMCDVRVTSNSTAYRELLGRAKAHSFDLAVALHRLNPTNAYHAVWEDMLPVLGMLRRGGRMCADAKVAMRQLRTSRWGVVVVDRLGPDFVDRRLWRELLPEVAVVHAAGPPVWAAKLVAGTGTACAHWGHCQPLDRPRGTFDPPDSAAAFRDLVFHRFGIKEDKDPRHGGDAAPRVTVVQRSRTRRLRNLEELVQIVREEMDVEPMVVDMANMTALEQVAVSHNTDIMVMVHGGALVNTMWLPRAALLVDIYPYAFPISYHSGIVHWMRGALDSVGLGHHPFQVLSSEGQELDDGPVKANCTCLDVFVCQASVFGHTTYVTVEAERFRQHIRQGLELWRGGRYAAPIGPSEFDRNSELARVEDLSRADLPMCM